MKSAIILGSNSDIAKGLVPFLEADGWTIHPWSRLTDSNWPCWDLVINCLGRIAPVGFWAKQNSDDWEDCMDSNLFLPLRLLRSLWPERNPGAAVCFLAGSNPNMIMDGYSAYNISKMAVLKLVEQLDFESQSAKFFALAPGIVLTKIHEQSEGWPNSKLAAVKEGAKDPVTIAQIYFALKWCLAQPKDVIGGRNICVSDLWDGNNADLNEALIEELKKRSDLFKLRREE